MTSADRRSWAFGKGFAAAGALALAVLSNTSVAHAHGGVVRAFEILNNEKHPDTFIMRSDVWGFFHSQDKGQTWEWSCAEVYSAISTSVNHNNMALTDSGRLLVASGFRGLFYTDDFCSWSSSSGLDDELVADVRNVSGDSVMVLTSTGSQTGIQNKFWTSSDKGGTFQVFSQGLPTDAVLSSFAAAPSDPKRVYAIGLVVESTNGTVFVSDDGAKTFKRYDAPSIPDAARVTLRIAGIHPTNPDVAFEWVDLPEELNVNAPDELHMTTDGGKTWTKLFTAAGDLPGFAISPDGKTVTFSGAVDGVYSAPLAEVVSSKSPAAFKKINDQPAWGLLWNATGLYGGTNNFSARGTPQTYTLGISEDDGASFNEVVNICEFKYSTCAPGTVVRKSCDFLWEDPSEDAGGFKKDFWENSGRCGPDGGGATGSGGAPAGTGATSSSGGGTSASGGASTGSGGAAATGGTPSGETGGTTGTGAGPSNPDGNGKDDGGCSFSASASDTPSGSLFALALGALGLGILRRRR